MNIKRIKCQSEEQNKDKCTDHSFANMKNRNGFLAISPDLLCLDNSDCTVKGETENNTIANTDFISKNRSDPHKLPPHTQFFNIVYNSVFIDNTYEGFQDFASQQETIHSILRLIDERTSQKNYLIVPKFCFLFATYSVGKEKIFFTVAEYLNFTIYANKYKMERLKCITKDVQNKLQYDVDSILQKYRKPHKTTTDLFSRLTNIEKNDCQIKLVSMMNLRSTIYEQTKDLQCDRVCIFIGTGWHNKIEYKDFIKSSGCIVKSGIEIIYFPYSEHSSNEELVKFKSIIKTHKFINTVKSKGKITTCKQKM